MVPSSLGIGSGLTARNSLGSSAGLTVLNILEIGTGFLGPCTFLATTGIFAGGYGKGAALVQISRCHIGCLVRLWHARNSSLCRPPACGNNVPFGMCNRRKAH